MEFNIRSDEEWFAEYDESLPEFQWFIEDYFKPIVLERLQRARKRLEINVIKTALNEIWFALPGNKFNIEENPKGWREFLSLIEE